MWCSKISYIPKLNIQSSLSLLVSVMSRTRSVDRRIYCSSVVYTINATHTFRQTRVYPKKRACHLRCKPCAQKPKAVNANSSLAHNYYFHSISTYSMLPAHIVTRIRCCLFNLILRSIAIFASTGRRRQSPRHGWWCLSPIPRLWSVVIPRLRSICRYRASM